MKKETFTRAQELSSLISQMELLQRIITHKDMFMVLWVQQGGFNVRISDNDFKQANELLNLLKPTMLSFAARLKEEAHREFDSL